MRLTHHSTRTKTILALAATAALLTLAPAAFADGHGHGRGHAYGHRGYYRGGYGYYAAPVAYYGVPRCAPRYAAYAPVIVGPAPYYPVNGVSGVIGGQFGPVSISAVFGPRVHYSGYYGR
jgi:hypothetical protein